MSNYSEFFLKTASRVVQLECLEIYHPNFSKVYRLVRNATLGVAVRYEDGVVYQHDYYPLKSTHQGSRGDLDQGIQVNLGDLGEVVPLELDAVRAANGFSVKPTLKYRTFRSDDLNNVLYGPIVLEITTFSSNKEGTTFEAKAPVLSSNKTGEIYSLDRFQGLRGLL